jgi:hypothetical protein
MPEQLPLFEDRAAQLPDSLVLPVPLPAPLGEALAQGFIQVLARLLAAETEPPR